MVLNVLGNLVEQLGRAMKLGPFTFQWACFACVPRSMHPPTGSTGHNRGAH